MMKKILLMLSLIVIGMFLMGCTSVEEKQAAGDLTDAEKAQLPPDMKEGETALAGQAVNFGNCLDSDSTTTFDKNSLVTKSKTTYASGSFEDKCYTWNKGTLQEKTRLIEGTCKNDKFLYWYATCSDYLGKDSICYNGLCVVNTNTLANYPNMFVKDGVFNGLLVVGEKASPLDNLAMTDIASSMKYESEDGQLKSVEIHDATKLDSEIIDYKAQNLIVIGNPCVNTIAAELLGNPVTCNAGFTPGKATIELFKHATGKYTLLVAGYTEIEDRLAAKVIANRWKELSGTFVEITGNNW